MKTNRVLLVIFIVILNQACYSQQSESRLNILSSNNSKLRQEVVDSIINESFWYEKANYIPWWLLKKEDFSEKSKMRLISYFNREISRDDIENIRNECMDRLMKDSVQMRTKSEKQNIPFDIYLKDEINKEYRKDANRLSILAKSRISPLYARLLGWLNYKPAISVLEAVIRDSLVTNEYAIDNKEELRLNCRLALARMGDRECEKELISQFTKIDEDCSKSDFYKPFIDLFYINTEKSISIALKISDTDRTYKVPHPDSRLELPNCSPNNIVKLYLSMVLNNYPLLNSISGTKLDLYPNPGDAYIWLYDEDIINQMNSLNVWLRQNKNNYQINNNRFYYY